jgi:hypothetical protein
VTLFDAPKRLVDTRYGIGGPVAPLASLVQREVTSLTGVPAGATAVIANLTATEGMSAGWMSAFPCGPVPPVSNVNYSAGQNIANHAYVPIVNGRFCLVSNQQTHAVVDIAGYVSGAAAFVPMTPERLYDSREQAKAKCNLGVLAVADGTYRLVELSPWTPGPALPIAGGSHMRVSRDCREITVVSRPGLAPVEPTSTLTRYDLAGNVVERLSGVGTDRTYFTDTGLVGFEQATGIVYDASTGENVFQVPTSVRSTMTLSDVSADGSTLVFSTRNERGWLGWPRRVFDANGNDLGPLTPPVSIAASPFDSYPVLSPHGLYAAYADFRGCPGSPPCQPAVVVALLDGTIVDTVPAVAGSADEYGPPTWTSDGSLVFHVFVSRFSPTDGTWTATTQVVSWELFNRPTVVSSTPTVSGQLPRIVAAR